LIVGAAAGGAPDILARLGCARNYVTARARDFRLCWVTVLMLITIVMSMSI
jgi:hypothetical protein